MEYDKSIISSLLSNENEEDAINYLEKLIEFNSFNKVAKFDLALLYISTLVYADGYISSIELLEDILENDNKNIKIVILIAYIEDVYKGQIEDRTLDKINEFLKLNIINEISLGQLYYLKANYYRTKNFNLYLENLIESIKKDKESSLPYYDLGVCYNKMHKTDLSNEMFTKSFNNIKKVYDISEYINPLDFDELINEKIRGIHVSKINFESIKNLINV